LKIDSRFASVDFRMAWATCRARRQRWLISDPLDYAELERMEGPPFQRDNAPRAVEVDFLTRPKQSGGTRLEVFPDIFTSTYLQAVADRLGNRDLGLRNSLSAHLYGLRLKHANPYEVWSRDVPNWIRSQLSTGRVVVVADLRDYFGSVSRVQIAEALARARLENGIREEALYLVDAINGVPGPDGVPRSGIPVAPEDFFWLVADLVLEPLDLAIEAAPGTLAYARWVDDLFVATDVPMVERVLAELHTVANGHGFRLNEHKTHVLDSITDFERNRLQREHDLLTDLFLTVSVGAMSFQQQDDLGQLIGSLGAVSVEERRLWKRIYGLARRLRSPLLLDRALGDLAQMQGAEFQILSYLAALGWPRGTAATALQTLSHSETDARSLGALRALLGSSWPGEPNLGQVLRKLLYGPAISAHPFTPVLAFACLLKAGRQGTDVDADANQLMLRLPGLTSATARRVALEMLWLKPRLRAKLRAHLDNDPSPTVRGLRYFLDAGANRGILGHGPASDLSEGRRDDPWGGLGREIGRALTETQRQ
jgi:hypothetical protein